MNLAEIETFLTIVSTGSITRTADLLFLSQPTVSHRLRSLEEELNFPLIVRKKGLKQVDLTPKGADFIPIAERLLALWKETQTLSLSEEQIPITIGCTDSLNTALLAPLYCVGLTLAQMLAEVSDRYHYSLLPMLVLLAAVSGRTMKGERT